MTCTSSKLLPPDQLDDLAGMVRAEQERETPLREAIEAAQEYATGVVGEMFRKRIRVTPESNPRSIDEMLSDLAATLEPTVAHLTTIGVRDRRVLTEEEIDTVSKVGRALLSLKREAPPPDMGKLSDEELRRMAGK